MNRGGSVDPLLGVSKPMSTARSDAGVGFCGFCDDVRPPNRSTLDAREIGRIPGGGGRSGAIGIDIADSRVVPPVDCGVRETALCGGITPRGKGLPVGVGLVGSRGDRTGGVAGLGGSAGAVKESKSFNPANPVGRELLKVVDRNPWIGRGAIGVREVLLEGRGLAAGSGVADDGVDMNDENSSFTRLDFLDEELANDEKGSAVFMGTVAGGIVICLLGALGAFFFLEPRSA